MQRKVILLFIKAPVAGTVKTRLAADIGPAKALLIYRQLVTTQLRRLPPDWQCEIHFTPANAKAEMQAWLGTQRCYIPQTEGDLGDRLKQGFRQSFARGASTVCAIGGDCPQLESRHFAATETLLQNSPDDVVIGPSPDGGYYLIAGNQPFPGLLENIPWSTKQTLATTLERARSLNLRIHLLESLQDLDTADDLRKLENFLGAETSSV